MDTKYNVVKDQETKLDLKEDVITAKPIPKDCFLIPLRGFFYGFVYTLFSCLNSIFIKMATSYNSFNHAIMRYSVQLVIMFFFIKTSKSNFLGPKQSRPLLVLRGFVGSGAIIFGLLSLKLLDVSDVETLLNSSIIITALLGRIFLKEKISISHIFSLILTIFGVLFILRPNFLFGIESNLEEMFHLNRNQSLLNNRTADVSQTVGFNDREVFNSILGVTFVLLSAFFQSSLQVVTRKLSLAKIHFSVISIYPVYVGLPISILVSTQYPIKFIPLEILYSFCGGVLSVIGLIFLNKALQHEEAAKIVMLRTTGVLMSFIFQYFILDVSTDFLGVFGAVSIVFGTLTIMLTKLYGETYKSNFCCKILSFKF